MSKLTIALSTPWLQKCGIASYSYYLAHALAQQDCEVKVVRLYRFGNKDVDYYRHYTEEFPLDVDIIHIQNEYALFNWLELPFYQALRQRLEAFGLKIPIVTTMHATGNFRPDRIIHGSSDLVIVHNVFGWRTFKYPSTIVPMGIQKVKEPPPSELAKRRWGVKGKTVGIFGFVSEYKGLETLLRAVSKLEGVTLLVGGGWHVDTETPYMYNIKIYANRVAPRRVRWLGYVSEEDLPYFFGACDVMVFAHRMISESMALNTALAYGKATLTSNLPSFQEKAQRNIIQTFRHSDELAGKLKALLNEPELRGVLEKNAKACALKNSWTESAKKHIKLYESLLE